MAYERPPRLGTTPGMRTHEALKEYTPPKDSILRWHTVGRRPDGTLQRLSDIAILAGKDFWDYVEYVFPGCEKQPECVNWYLRYRYGCPETGDRKNRAFKGGELFPLPKLDSRDAKPIDPPTPPLIPGIYNRAAAVRYARLHVKSRNPNFPEPHNRNDCTNFVSQALLAGGWTMVGGTEWDYNNNDVWWYGRVKKADHESGFGHVVERIKDIVRDDISDDERFRYSQTWSGADNFARFLRASGRASEVSGPDKLQPGDILQLRRKSDGNMQHTMFVIERVGGELLYAQHTNDNTYSYKSYLLGRVHADQELVHWKVKDIIPPSR